MRPALFGNALVSLVDPALSTTRGGLPLSANLFQALTVNTTQPRRWHARSHAIDSGQGPKRRSNIFHTALHHDAVTPASLSWGSF
jgi:hypothetical protein